LLGPLLILTKSLDHCSLIRMIISLKN